MSIDEYQLAPEYAAAHAAFLKEARHEAAAEINCIIAACDAYEAAKLADQPVEKPHDYESEAWAIIEYLSSPSHTGELTKHYRAYICRTLQALLKRESSEEPMSDREKFLYGIRKPPPLRSDDMDYAGNLFGFRKEERKDQPPLIELYIEDDGWWHYKCCFSGFWLSDLKHAVHVAISEIKGGNND